MRFTLGDVSKSSGKEPKVTCSHSDSDAILDCSACMYFIIGFKWPENDTSPTSSQLALLAKSDKQLSIKIPRNEGFAVRDLLLLWVYK